MKINELIEYLHNHPEEQRYWTTDEIKQECPRVDIPKRLLIEIARKKSAKEMVDLFTRYKAQFLKADRSKNTPTHSPKKRAVRAPASIAVDRILHLSNYLPKINLDTVEEDQKLRLLSGLQNLKRLIDKILNG